MTTAPVAPYGFGPLDSSIFGMLGIGVDQRRAGLRRGLLQLTNEQLVRALTVPNVVVDSFNFCDGNFCPLACAVGLHETMADPSHEKVRQELERRGFKVNNTKGIKGEFYTTDRDRDWRLLAHEIILQRGKRRLVPVIAALHQPDDKQPGRMLLIQRGHDSKYPDQWCIPGGKIEGEESVVECAKREFREETGIDCDVRLIDEVDSTTSNDLRFAVFGVRFTSPRPPRVRIEDSFQGYGWFTRRDTEKDGLDSVMSPASIVAGWLIDKVKQ